MHQVRRYWERLRVPFYCEDDNRTEQGHKHSCDINNIVQRHMRAGGIPAPTTQPIYQDVTRLQGDLRERMEFAAHTLSRLEAAIADLQAASPGEAPPAESPPAPA